MFLSNDKYFYHLQIYVNILIIFFADVPKTMLICNKS